MASISATERPGSTSRSRARILPPERDNQLDPPVGKEHAIDSRHAEPPRLRLTGGCVRTLR